MNECRSLLPICIHSVTSFPSLSTTPPTNLIFSIELEKKKEQKKIGHLLNQLDVVLVLRTKMIYAVPVDLQVETSGR